LLPENTFPDQLTNDADPLFHFPKKNSIQTFLGANQGDQGPMLWFFKYFRRKIRQKGWHFWLKTKLNYAKFW
jgi:hypothetical protein